MEFTAAVSSAKQRSVLSTKGTLASVSSNLRGDKEANGTCSLEGKNSPLTSLIKSKDNCKQKLKYALWLCGRPRTILSRGKRADGFRPRPRQSLHHRAGMGRRSKEMLSRHATGSPTVVCLLSAEEVLVRSDDA